MGGQRGALQSPRGQRRLEELRGPRVVLLSWGKGGEGQSISRARVRDVLALIPRAMEGCQHVFTGPGTRMRPARCLGAKFRRRSLSGCTSACVFGGGSRKMALVLAGGGSGGAEPGAGEQAGSEATAGIED